MVDCLIDEGLKAWRTDVFFTERPVSEPFSQYLISHYIDEAANQECIKLLRERVNHEMFAAQRCNDNMFGWLTILHCICLRMILCVCLCA